MKRATLLRVLTLALAALHSLPARAHLAAVFERPSLEDTWKGLGALLAIGLYLLPPRWQMRGLRALWRRRGWLGALTAALALVHAVPLLEHLPRFLKSGSLADGWRGIGAAIAVAWFIAPTVQQGRFVAWLGRLARLDVAPARGRTRPSGAAPSLSQV